MKSQRNKQKNIAFFKRRNSGPNTCKTIKKKQTQLIPREILVFSFCQKKGYNPCVVPREETSLKLHL